MKITIKIYCGENEIFAPDALSDNVGKETEITGVGMGTVLNTEVVDDGKAALITFDVKMVKRSYQDRDMFIERKEKPTGFDKTIG